MSFSKAKIMRFNECKSDVPPPGAYDPKFGIASKGFTSEKKIKPPIEKRFPKCRSIDYNQIRPNEKPAMSVDSKFRTQISIEKKQTEDTYETMKKIQKDYAACFEKADFHRIVLEKKIDEQDMEISQLLSILVKLLNARVTQESFNQSLQAELDNVETELALYKEDVKNLKQLARNVAAEMVMRKRRCEVIIDGNQATIAALCQRLIENDAVFSQ